MAWPLFIGGTSSNAGKSWMATAFCAWLHMRGVSVAPFKAQNMSNNSYPCAGGGEIGRAQVAQAEACGVEPEWAMNPILLKPNGDGTSQVVVQGRVWKTLSAREYYAHADELLGIVLDAYANLARRFDVVIIEGAGSVSELNLRHVDLVNLGLVTRLGAPWILVADIERGGVFASVLGTVGTLAADERALFQGFAINKFRGDPSLFESGVALLESRTGARCLGVFPYADDIALDPEDSLSTPRRGDAAPGDSARVAIVRLPSLSNSTDVQILAGADWIAAPPARDYDVIVIPGTKHTIRDLAWLRRVRLDTWITSAHARGARVVGICGGYQMLGRMIADPDGYDGAPGVARGLGLLPVDTIMHAEKSTRAVTATTRAGHTFDGYEIHVGVTQPDPGTPPFATLSTGEPEGAVAGRVMGTCLHGALEDAAVCHELGLATLARSSKSEHYARLASWLEAHGRHLDQLLPDLVAARGLPALSERSESKGALSPEP